MNYHLFFPFSPPPQSVVNMRKVCFAGKLPYRSYLRNSTFKFIAIAIIGFLLSFCLLSNPVWALFKNSAPVAVDGRTLFQLKAQEKNTAKKRAEAVNKVLKEVVKSEGELSVEIKIENQSPTLRVNEKYLFTVTREDIVPPNTPNRQAELWKEKITEAINEARNERSADFRRTSSILSVVIVFLGAICHKLLGSLWQIIRTRVTPLLGSNESSQDGDLSDNHEDQHKTFDFLLKSTLLLARTALWVAIALYISNLFPLTRQLSFNIASRIVYSLSAPILSLGDKSYSIINILILVGLFFGLFIVAGSFTNVLRSRFLRLLRISRGAQEATAVVFKYLVIGVGTVVLLQIWGVDLSSLAILLSAFSVGIGFGFQDIAKNFGSGLVLIFERPIQVGDFIKVGEHTGTVEQIGARSVTIRTLDRVSIIVPNSRFLESEVINWSHRNPISRIHLPVGVSYSSNIYQVKTALLEAAVKHPEVLRVPQPQVFFKGFGDSALDFELLVWIDQPPNQEYIKSDLNFYVEAALQRNKIEIPFPQTDVHVRSGELPIKISPEVEELLKHLSLGVNSFNTTTNDKDTGF